MVTRYLDSRFFGHAKADDLCAEVVDMMESNALDSKLLLNLSTDGPNINTSLWGKLNEKLLSLGFHGLLPLVVCCLHIVHKAFHYGCVQHGSEVESLAVDLHGWFKIAPCKREDIHAVSKELGESSPLFQRHVESRWLTLVPALQEVEEHWKPAEKYFEEFLPSQKDEFKRYTSKNERYGRIIQKFKEEEKRILVQMAFVVHVSAPSNTFLLSFPGEGPLIHLLFSELKKLLVTIMKRYIQADEITGKKLLVTIMKRYIQADEITGKKLLVTIMKRYIQADEITGKKLLVTIMKRYIQADEITGKKLLVTIMKRYIQADEITGKKLLVTIMKRYIQADEITGKKLLVTIMKRYIQADEITGKKLLVTIMKRYIQADEITGKKLLVTIMKRYIQADEITGKKLLVTIMKRYIQADEITGKGAKALLKIDVEKKK